jgi:pimeloyl-ACP methyl ester carboxylesterase
MRWIRAGYIIVVVLGLWAIAGYLATMPVVGYHAFWREMRAEPEDFSLTAEPAWFPAIDGVPLHGWFIHADGGARGTIILAHGIDGNSSDMLPRAWFLVHCHYSVLLVDLRDHGKSGGNYASPGYMEARDILGALSYLRHGRHIRGPIVAFGHSYGAVACIFAAAESPDIAAVISDGAFISFVNMMHRATVLLAQDPQASFWDRLGLRLAGTRLAEWLVLPMYYLRTGVWASNRRADVLKAIPHLDDRPILFIAGQLDKICPAQNTKIMYNAARSPEKELFVVPGADHDATYADAPQRYQKTVVTFLQKAL